MNLSKNKLSVICFFIPFILYLSTLCPNLYWRDAGEFQVVAYQLGISHPAGSPLYDLVAKIFTFLPFGSIAFKVNLASAFFGAVLISLTFLLIIECLEIVFSPQDQKCIAPEWNNCGVFFCGFIHSLWNVSIQAFTKTFQNCFIVLIALLLVRGIKQTEKKPPLYLAAFLFGLTPGAHIIMILYIPALLLSLVILPKLYSLIPSGNHNYVRHLRCFYLSLPPVRSSTNPWSDWGNPKNVQILLSM